MTSEEDVGSYYINEKTNELYYLASYCRQPTVHFRKVHPVHGLDIGCADGAPLMKDLRKRVPEKDS